MTGRQTETSMWTNKLTHSVDQTETWSQLKEADSDGGQKEIPECCKSSKWQNESNK